MSMAQIICNLLAVAITAGMAIVAAYTAAQAQHRRDRG